MSSDSQPGSFDINSHSGRTGWRGAGGAVGVDAAEPTVFPLGGLPLRYKGAGPVDSMRSARHSLSLSESAILRSTQVSEAMTAELIVEAEWLLEDGYWTKVRFPFQTAGRGWSDIDVLAYSPSKKHLVVSESKVQGPKNKVYGYTPDTNHYFIDKSYLGFLDNLPVILSDGVVFDCFAESVDCITVQLVSNAVILPGLLDEARASVVGYVENNCEVPSGVRVEAMLDSTLDVLARVIERERERHQGRRYGHAVIDIARELNRYLAPSIAGAGQGKARTDPVKRQGIRSFWEAIGGREVAAFLGAQDWTSQPQVQKGRGTDKR